MPSKRKQAVLRGGGAVIAMLALAFSCSMHGSGSDAPYSRDPGLFPVYVGILALIGLAVLLDRIK